jgi:serine/threonine-protein kinase
MPDTQVTVPSRTAATRRPETSTSSRTSPLWSALVSEAGELEVLVARAGQLVSLLGIGLATVVALLVAPALGWSNAAVGVVALVWFTVLRKLLAQGRHPQVLRWVAPVVEVMAPALILIGIVSTQGARYAAGSWVPPQLFVAFVVFSILRLNPRLCAVLGVVAAAEYAAVFFLLMRPELVDQRAGEPLLADDMQLVRSTSLVLVGLISAAATTAVRRAVRHAESEVRANELFGKYRLGPEIASGGMGTVVRATYCPEGGFERPVAIKRIHPHLARDPRFVAEFRHEAELCARLLHPNIVSVFDFGRHEDTYFFAMEFVDGPHLGRLARRVRRHGMKVPGRVAALIGREVAEGLRFAHSVARDSDGRLLRVVHRDLSPNNVLLSEAGQVKVSDFGIARVLLDANSHHTDHHTGKLSYMAPEQARGEPFDERVDLFALGVVLWELLMLRPLFTRASQAATVLAVIEAEVPSPNEERSELAEAWREFFRLALERDASARFQSAEEMIEGLDKVLLAEGTPRPDELRAWLGSLPDDAVILPGEDDPEAKTLADAEVGPQTQPEMSHEDEETTLRER